jgi:EpsI family protein
MMRETLSTRMSTPVAVTVGRTSRAAPAWIVAWAVVAAGGVALLVLLAVDVWPKRPEMGDRFLIPLASTAVIFALRSRWRTTALAPAATGLIGVAVGAIAFPPAWYLAAQVGPRTLLLWWLASALTSAALGLVVAGQGWRRGLLLIFPFLFAFFALPTPDMLQARLLGSLKAATASAAAAVLPWLGVPAARSGLGYTLNLPSGKLGVVDACSGALSLTSLLAVATLTAYVRIVFRRDFTLGRAIVLVVMTIPIVVASNALRVVASGLLFEYVGPTAVEGVWHSLLGYMVVVVGFGMIVGLSQMLAVPTSGGARSVESETPGNSEGILASSSALDAPRFGVTFSAVVAVILLMPAAGFCVWAERFRTGGFELADLREIPFEVPGWQGREATVPPDVAEMLKCDQLLHRVYTDRLGHAAEVYFMFWATPASTAHMHHPDVCWPARGCSLAEGRVRPVPYAEGRTPLGVSVRHYDNDRGQREVVFYWTQNGNDVLPDGKESDLRSSEYGWVVDMLRGREAQARVSRISVLIASDVPVGTPADQEQRLAGLCGKIAEALYQVCHWAKPTN